MFTIIWLPGSSLGGDLQERPVTAGLQTCFNHTSKHLGGGGKCERKIRIHITNWTLGGLAAPSQDGLWVWGGSAGSKGLGKTGKSQVGWNMG